MERGTLVREERDWQTFGSLLRRYRLAAELTQEELADKAGLSARAIGDIERGVRRFPYKDTIHRLALALGLDPEQHSMLVALARRARLPPEPRKPPRSEPVLTPVASASHVQQQPRGNSPEPLTSLIGRERDLAAIRRLLSTTRILTLSGVGGIGKTRLALELTRSCAEDVNITVIELASVSEATVVDNVVAACLGIPEQPGRPVVETIVDSLRTQTILLVLDNCEHVLARCAQLASAILNSCPHVQVLTTSREPLNIRGEVCWRVPPLEYLPPEESASDAVVGPPAAVALFVDRARARKPGFQFSDDAAAISDICRRLDGLPLAIELAAARVPVLSPLEIASRLDDSFRLLTQGNRDAPPRHQTLKATLDWSYGLLFETEQALLRRLSVFADGFTFEAAVAVCSTPPLDDTAVLNDLDQLVNKSLVVTEQLGDGTTRYRLLETVRQFAAGHLHARLEDERILEQHAHYYLKHAERIEDLRKVDWPRWRREGWPWLSSEMANLRVVLERCRTGIVDSGGEAQIGLRLCSSLFMFWWVHDRWKEAWDTHTTQLETSQPIVSSARFWCCFYAGVIAGIAASFDASEHLLNDALTIAKALPDRQLTALSYGGIGQDLLLQGRLEQAQEFTERGLAMAREVGPIDFIPVYLFNAGWLALRQGKLEAAASLLDEAILVARDRADDFALAIALPLRGTASVLRAEYANAREFLLEAQRVSSSLPFRGLGIAETGLGRLALLEGKTDEAAEYFQIALGVAERTGRRVQICEALEGLAFVLEARGNLQVAVRSLGALETERRTIYRGRPPDFRNRMQVATDRLRTSLGTAEFDVHWNAGTQLSLDQAVADVRGFL
ncbi:MAG TPA: tetratricopeptide repeat protein [Chloroflexota bacterium]